MLSYLTADLGIQTQKENSIARGHAVVVDTNHHRRSRKSSEVIFAVSESHNHLIAFFKKLMIVDHQGSTFFADVKNFAFDQLPAVVNQDFRFERDTGITT